MSDASLAAVPDKFRTAFDRLHEMVAARVGSSDFGDDDYRAGLHVLLESMDYDPVFTEHGRRSAWNGVADALGSRAIAFRSFKEHPDYRKQAIPRPIFIVGMPRTGTTALHKLMSVDPQFQGLEKWLLGAPMPRPPRETWEQHPYFQKEVEQLEMRFGATPMQRAAHNMVAEEVDECLWVQRQSFVNNFWPCGWSAATYDAWWQAQDERPSYDYLRRTIQLVGMNDPGRRWLLKNPSHVLHMDLLFETFPDALVVHTHRDPARAVPSLCALLIQAHAVMEVGRYEQRAHNSCVRETAKWAKGLRDGEPVRRARPGQIMDVIHADFHARPLETVRRIYDFVGLELTPDVEAAMRARIAASPETSHGVHTYDIADFGMTEDELRAQYGDYIDRFDLRPKETT